MAALLARDSGLPFGGSNLSCDWRLSLCLEIVQEPIHNVLEVGSWPVDECQERNSETKQRYR